MEELAVQASSSTETAQDRDDQAQLTALLQAITATSQVQYNGLALLTASVSSNPTITAIAFQNIAASASTAFTITIEGYQFPPNPTEPSPNASVIALPSMTNVAQLIVYDQTAGWTAGFTEQDDNGYGTNMPLEYVSWSSTAIVIGGATTGARNPQNYGVQVGDTIAFTLASHAYDVVTRTDDAFAKATIAGPNTLAIFPLPLHTLSALGSSGVLPVVTPLTLGVADLSLATASAAQTSLQTLQTAIARLSTAQANLGSQQAALQDQVARAQTTSLQLTQSQAALTDANLPQVTRQLAQRQLLNQTGLQLLTDEHQLAQQTGHWLALTESGQITLT